MERRFPQPAGEVEVLRDYSLALRGGEFLTVVGPSGCGKSTLLRLLGGFVAPNGGEVRARGKTVRRPDPHRVMMFQDFDQLFPWKTVAANVEFALIAGKGRASLGKVERRERRQKILEEVGLGSCGDFFPHQLSGGMKQRVALARTLVGRPEVVLMDEPFGSVDAQKREELQELLLSIRSKRKFAAVFVTHDIQEAVFLGDRVVVMGPAGAPLKDLLEVGVERPRKRDDDRLEQLRTRIRGLIGESLPDTP